jgi:hypothetical protein
VRLNPAVETPQSHESRLLVCLMGAVIISECGTQSMIIMGMNEDATKR